jgi:hypothetical protein
MNVKTLLGVIASATLLAGSAAMAAENPAHAPYAPAAGGAVLQLGAGDPGLNAGADPDTAPGDFAQMPAGGRHNQALLLGPGSPALNQGITDTAQHDGSSTQIPAGGRSSQLLQMPQSPSNYAHDANGANRVN